MSSDRTEPARDHLSPGSPEPGTEPTVPLRTDDPGESPQAWSHEERPPQPVAHAPEPTSTHDERADRRQLSVGHLVAGLVFLGIAGLWLAQEAGAVDTADMDLLVPVLLIVVGAAGLLAGLLRAARRG